MEENAAFSDLAQLQAQLALYEETQEIAHIGSWYARVGPESELGLTKEARRIFGFAPDATVRNLDLFNIVHADDRQRLLETIIRVRTEQTTADLMFRIIRDGWERHLLAVVAPAVDAQRGSGEVLGTIQDVTERPHGLGAADEERISVEIDLRRALRSQQLFMEYQPIVSLADGLIVGAEALVRWDHPGRGRIEPDDFVGLAERSGLIVPLGAWVLETACRELRRWQDAGIAPGFRLSVNLSAAQLRSDAFPMLLEQVVADVGIPWASLTLEVTESVLVEDVLEATLRRIRGRGVLIALDDFGTKYSALGYLPRLPIDVLKIDASFVQGIDDVASRAVVTAIIAIGRALGLTVIAEGVETEAQLVAVRELDCDAIQGYVISPPVGPAELLKLLQANGE